MPKYKLVFFTPRSSTQTVLQHLFARFPNHVGRIGAYAGCAFVSPGTGQFLPLEGANPTIGARGKVEHVEEDRVEVLVLSQSNTHTPTQTQTQSQSQSQSQDSPSSAGRVAAGVADADAEGDVSMGAVLEELKKVHPYEEVACDVYRLEDF